MNDQATLQGADLLFADDAPTETNAANEPTEVESDAKTVDETQAEVETAPDETEEDADGETEDESEDSDSSDDDSTDDDEEEALYLDLDGEDFSLDEIRDWRKAHEVQGKVTQKRMEDARREKQNVANEGRITDRLQRTEAISTVIGDLIESLKSEGYSDEDIKGFESKAETIREKLVLDAETDKNSKAIYERNLLIKRNKTWFDDDGSHSKEGEKQFKFINEYIAKEGYTADEVNNMLSHKMIMSLHKAAKFDALQKKTVDLKKKVRKAPVTSKPKARPKAAPKPRTAEESVFDL